jgi:hypothetical protein
MHGQSLAILFVFEFFDGQNGSELALFSLREDCHVETSYKGCIAAKPFIVGKGRMVDRRNEALKMICEGRCVGHEISHAHAVHRRPEGLREGVEADGARLDADSFNAGDQFLKVRVAGSEVWRDGDKIERHFCREPLSMLNFPALDPLPNAAGAFGRDIHDSSLLDLAATPIHAACNMQEHVS